MTSEEYRVEIEGVCPICEQSTKFVAKGPWFRGALMCTTCTSGSVPRERALAKVVNRTLPLWRDLRVHESSPAERGFSLKMQRECARYVASHFYPDRDPGSVVNGYRNENLESQTFPDGMFDLVVTLDVFEHVFEPGKMIKEIHRTLKPGGYYICTFPIRKAQVESHRPRVKQLADGSLEHLEKPEYHGNPISGDGALVTFDYGYAIHSMITCWAEFDVEITRFADRTSGILGEYTEVISCRKWG